MLELVTEMIGIGCTRRTIGRDRSLSLGFGEAKAEAAYREWELGTYSAGWRFLKGDTVLLGSMDIGDVEVARQILERLELGTLISISSISPFDIRVTLSCNTMVDFFCLTTDDDEMFHVFAPRNRYLEFKPPGIWTQGRSDQPWGQSEAANDHPP